MKYVVANANGIILNDDASRQSDAVNWARNRVGGETTVKKIPEIIKIAAVEGRSEVLMVTDEDTARMNGWLDPHAVNVPDAANEAVAG